MYCLTVTDLFRVSWFDPNKKILRGGDRQEIDKTSDFSSAFCAPPQICLLFLEDPDHFRFLSFLSYFPTCQVRVVRFYVSCFLLVLVLLLLLPLLVLLLLLLSSLLSSPRLLSSCSLPDLNHDHPRPVFPAGPQPRPSMHSVLCRTSTTTIHAQCSLPDLNHDHPRPVFPAGPQPRPSPPSVPCRTSTTTIHAQCSLPDLNREYPRQVFPAGPHDIVSWAKVPWQKLQTKVVSTSCFEMSWWGSLEAK